MTDTVAERIRQSAYTSLAGITGIVGLNLAERNRDAPIEEAELPAIVMLDGATQPAETQWTGSDAYETAIEVQLYAKGADMAAATAALDALEGKALAAILADRSRAGLAIDTRLAASSETERDGAEGHPAQASRALQFTISFATAENDPFTLAA